MIGIPGGVFCMGSTREEIAHAYAEWSPHLINSNYTAEMFYQWLLKEYPAHGVRLQQYAIAKFPVTNRQYHDYVNVTRAPMPWSLKEDWSEDHPVWGVSFHEAKRFVSWLAMRTGKGYRLPNEAEWEFAARGTARLTYPFGNHFDPTVCNTAESGRCGTTSVDAFAQGASPFGIWDMAGNVEEWVDTNYAPYEGGRFISDDLSKTWGPRYPILRGGSWRCGGDLARCARRHGPHPDRQYRYAGFRLASDG